MKIIIDGYNLLWAAGGSQSNRSIELEKQRDDLLLKLSRYYSFKRIPITVVFDGWENGGFSQSHEKRNNINIIYSKQGEKADEVIKRIASKQACIVVTSDREIVDFVEKNGATVISCLEFEDKISMASCFSEKGLNKEENDDNLDRPITTKKKGNPKKLSRTERNKKKRLKKL